MAWNDLYLSDRARMIQLAVKSGITDLSTIQEVYNTFAEGGSKETKSLSDKEYYQIMERAAEEKYSKWGMQSPEGIKGGHQEAGRFIPSSGQHKYLTGGDTEGTDNPFEYTRNTYVTNTMTADFARELNDSVNARNFGFAPEAIAYAIGTESGYRVNAKNKNSSARGVLQLTRPTIQEMYGAKQGNEIYQQYIDDTRSQSDQIHDAMVYLQKRDDNITTNRNDMSAGRLKTNLLAPNSAMSAIISDAVWKHSLSKSDMSILTQGKSTYNDLARIYNQDFDIFLQGYNAQKSKKSKKKKKI